jgi:hypothetical protein
MITTITMKRNVLTLSTLCNQTIANIIKINLSIISIKIHLIINLISIIIFLKINIWNKTIKVNLILKSALKKGKKF